METKSALVSITELKVVVAQRDAALAACHSICDATKNAVLKGGYYSLNDLLAADKLARAALKKQMTPKFVDQSARAILAKYRAQQATRKRSQKN